MASENTMNDATSFQQSDASILCANGCGFFGTASTMNLCSKCYRDHKMQEEQTATAMAAVEKSMSSAPPSSPAKVVVVVAEEKPAVLVVDPSSSSEVEEKTEDVAVVAPPAVKAANRCGGCNKKVGVMGFKCRCGSTFCGSHRYPEEHDCSFDFKGAGKEAIAKANPVVKADKVERF